MKKTNNVYCDSCKKIITGKRAITIRNEKKKQNKKFGFCNKICYSNFYNKNRDAEYICDFCKIRIIGRKARKINIKIKNKETFHGFCNAKCQNEFIKNTPKIPDKENICSNCKEIFFRKRWRHPKFCSRKCSVIFNNKRKDNKTASCIMCKKKCNNTVAPTL